MTNFLTKKQTYKILFLLVWILIWIYIFANSSTIQKIPTLKFDTGVDKTEKSSEVGNPQTKTLSWLEIINGASLANIHSLSGVTVKNVVIRNDSDKTIVIKDINYIWIKWEETLMLNYNKKYFDIRMNWLWKKDSLSITLYKWDTIKLLWTCIDWKKAKWWVIEIKDTSNWIYKIPLLQE